MHTTIEFEHQDWLGTERLETAYNGQALGSSTSLPFGDGFSSTNACDEPGHFATLDQDSTSNEHAQFREYSNMAGRWFSPDPYQGSYDFSNPQSFNRYTYALNNPLSFIDPSGLIECIVTGGDTWSVSAGGDTTIGTDPVQTECFDDDPASGVTVGGSDGGTGLQTLQNLPTSPIDPCANVNLSAAGVNIHEQLAVTKAAVSGGGIAGFLAYPMFSPFSALAGALGAYAGLVNTHRPFDVKNQPGPGTYQQRVAAGNIAYGITCPFGASFCQFAAGVAQTIGGNPDPNGTPGTGFDTPSDNAQIQTGQAMRAAGCHQ